MLKLQKHKKMVMNKKTSKKSAPKSRSAVKLRATTSKKTVASKAKRSTKVAASTQRKGIKHHAKRIYRLTPKFVHGVIAGAFVGVVVVASLGYTGGVNANPAAANCIQTQGGINVNDKHANAFVRLKGACGKHTLVMKSYYAPAANGEPHNQQVQFQVGDPQVVKSGGSNEWVKLNVDMPDPGCFFQVDLVDISNPAGSEGYPMVAAKTGGNHDCTPDQSHHYACSSLGLTPGDNRTVTVSTFTVTAQNATFTGATIDWSDGNVQAFPTALNQTHTFAADGNYEVRVIAHFTYTGQFGGVHNVDAAPCAAPITFTTPPPNTQIKMIFVCEIATKRVLNIDEAQYGTATYPLDKFTKDLSQCVVTPPPAVQPTALVNTGPGAVLIVLGLATLGGYAFHMRHRHVQHKKRHAH
jgi:F0F1-type ATP synthase assembly protein I